MDNEDLELEELEVLLDSLLTEDNELGVVELTEDTELAVDSEDLLLLDELVELLSLL